MKEKLDDYLFLLVVIIGITVITLLLLKICVGLADPNHEPLRSGGAILLPNGYFFRLK